MKKHHTLLLLLVVLLSAVPLVFAGQTATDLSYNVESVTYSEIVAGTQLASGSGISGYSSTQTLPFTFGFNGESYTDVTIFGNGEVQFGSAGTTAIKAWARSLDGTTLSELRVQTLGDSPNRIYVIQWSNVTRAPAGSTSDSYNFQIRLNEATGKVQVVYGTMTVTGAVGALIGAVMQNSQPIILTARNELSTWLNPRLNAGESIALQGWAPSSGLAYTFGAPEAVDAAIVSLSAPSGKFNPNTNQMVTAVLRNTGTDAIDSVEVAWKVNGATRTGAKYFADPAIQPGEEVSINLGTVNFSNGSYNKIEVWSVNPNSEDDENPGNDKLVTYMAPRTSGSLYVAPTGNIGIFTSFRDCINLLSVGGISGDITVYVYNGTYNEQIIIPEFNNSSATGTVTFKAVANNTPIISWTPQRYPDDNYGDYEANKAQITLLEGASVVIDGLMCKLAGNQQWGGHINAQQAGKVTITNCVFVGPTNVLDMVDPVFSVVLDGVGPFTVHNNQVLSMPLGIAVSASSPEVSSVTGNTVDKTYLSGIIVESDNLLIQKNKVLGLSGAPYFYGLGAFGAGTVNANLVQGSAKGENNAATGIEAQSNDGASQGPQGLLVSNNMVLVSSTLSTTGLRCEANAVNAATRVLHNTIRTAGTAGGGNSVAAYFVGEGLLDIINNIFDNTDSVNGGGYAIYLNDLSTNGFIHAMDFNNYMVNGDTIGFNQVTIERNGTGDPLASWKTSTGADQSSTSVTVSFAGEADLHLKNIQSELFGSSAVTQTVPKDIDDEVRQKPYKGADELYPRVDILESPQSRFACLGEAVTLVCVSSVTGGAATVTYQWYKDGKLLPNQTSNKLIINSVGYTAAGVYSCRVQVTDGTNTRYAESEPAVVMVVRPTSIVKHPQSQPVAMGSTVVLEIEAEAVGSISDPVPSYQWKKRYWDKSINGYVDTNVVDNSRITGSRSSKLTITNLQPSDTANTYVCYVIAYCGNATSKAARLFAPMVYASTSTLLACEGGVVNLEVLIQPEDIPGTSKSYQWFRGTLPLIDIPGTPGVTGATSKALRITGVTQEDAGKYTCVISFNDIGVEIKSNEVDIPFSTKPTITIQPIGDTLCEGEVLNIIVHSSGVNLKYQWLKDSTRIPGATGPEYIMEGARASATGVYAVVISNDCGVDTTEFVNVVVKSPVEIVEEPRDAAIYDGDSLTISVTATGSDTVRYQWYKDDSLIVGATDSAYVIDSATGDDQGGYYCIVTNDCGEVQTITARLSVTVGVDEGDAFVAGYSLSEPAPNPTSGNLNINYAVKTEQTVYVHLVNTMGQTVATLHNGTAHAGNNQLVVNLEKYNIPAGTYSLILSGNGVTLSRRVVVIR